MDHTNVSNLDSGLKRRIFSVFKASCCCLHDFNRIGDSTYLAKERHGTVRDQNNTTAFLSILAGSNAASRQPDPFNGTARQPDSLNGSLGTPNSAYGNAREPNAQSSSGRKPISRGRISRCSEWLLSGVRH